MEIIEIRIEYPSGMSITDRASYLADAGHVYPSERLQAVLREFCISEAPPVASAVIDGANVQLQSRIDGSFAIGDSMGDGSNRSFIAIAIQPFSKPTKDQRQQIGRFLHTLSAAAFLGAVGVWHSTSVWTFADIKLEVSLIGAFVLTFVQGMIAIKGE